jgi:hypothetical protein
VYYKCVKFHKNSISGLGGVALTKYMDGQTDGRTDRVIHIYPPNFVDNSTYTFTKRGGMYFVSAIPTKLLIEFL